MGFLLQIADILENDCDCNVKCLSQREQLNVTKKRNPNRQLSRSVRSLTVGDMVYENEFVSLPPKSKRNRKPDVVSSDESVGIGHGDRENRCDNKNNQIHYDDISGGRFIGWSNEKSTGRFSV